MTYQQKTPPAERSGTSHETGSAAEVNHLPATRGFHLTSEIRDQGRLEWQVVEAVTDDGNVARRYPVV